MAVIQSAHGTPSTTATATVAAPQNVVAGNRIFAETAYSRTDGTATDVTVTSPGNTWTKLVGSVYNAGGSPADNIFSSLWSCVAASSAAMTITATGVTGQEIAVTMWEESGLDSSAGSGCLDVSATGNNAGGLTGNTTDCSTGTTAATHAANQRGLMGIGDWGATATWTVASGGFTKMVAGSAPINGACIDANSTNDVAVASKTSASGATEVGTWHSGVAASEAAWVAVIKLAAVATGIPDVTMAPMR